MTSNKMKPFVCLLVVLIATFITTDLLGQPRRKKPAPKKAAPKIEDPCGIRQTIQEFIEETSIEWRPAAETDDERFYYNTQKMRCAEQGVLKVWIKWVPKLSKYPLDHSMTRYEFKCLIDQVRIVSQTDYDPKGSVLKSETFGDAKWKEIIPHTVGEDILNTVCRKAP